MDITKLGKIEFIILSILFLLLHSFIFEKWGFCMGSNKMPTAIIVDANSGEPIEGAVAIAIWRKHSIKEAAWFEGGKMMPVRIEEAISDKEGKVYFEDFWDWHLFENRNPRLTVYKFGYVCWDQKQIFMPLEGSTVRKDFNERNRLVRMRKWPKDFSFVRHGGFVDYSTGYGDMHKADKTLFLKAFRAEDQYIMDERKHRGKNKNKPGK